MIETTYIRLARAAAMLDTDADTLLIAAAEGRVKLYGLAAEWRDAELVLVTDDPFDETNGTIVRTRRRFFGFVPILPWAALVLLKGGEAEIQALTDERKLNLEPPFDWNLLPQWATNTTDMGYWRDAEGGASDPLKVGRDSIFVSAESVLDILRTGATPAPGTIKDAPPRRPVPRDNSLICTLAALLSVWPGGTTPSGKDLEKAAQSLGLTLSDDTIRKALKAAQEAAPSLPPPK